MISESDIELRIYWFSDVNLSVLESNEADESLPKLTRVLEFISMGCSRYELCEWVA